MAPLKFKHVLSCSSEDKVYKAENLLDTHRKWKCSKHEENGTSVILQLEKASQIHSIDVGNEGSAFIEVMVGQSVNAGDFKVLLVSSSFMTPMESRQGRNLNRVRMFDLSQLNGTTVKEKWDLVKILCTQPYNKTIQYGLSFIRVHSPPDQDPTNNTSQKDESKLGAFKLKADNSDDEKPTSVGSWFKKRNSQPTDPLVSPAAIRKATFATESLNSKPLPSFKQQGEKRKASSPPSSPKPKKANSECIDPPPVKKPKTEEIASTSKSEKKAEDSPKVSKVTEPKVEKKQASTSKPQSSSSKKTTSKIEARPSTSSTSNPKIEKKNVPFNQLMSETVFVLSGFQNPYRSDLRDKALDMGAKYKGDWTSDATHLVCAFVNTPKYQQVRTKNGKIVKKEWILDSHKNKKLMPWRDYKLGNYSTPNSPNSSPKRDRVKKESKTRINNSIKQMGLNSEEEDNDDSDNDPLYDADTDIDSDEEKEESGIDASATEEESEVDTEEEIERVKSKMNKKKAPSKAKNKTSNSRIKFDSDEEEEETKAITSKQIKIEDSNSNDIQLEIEENNLNNLGISKTEDLPISKIDTSNLPLPELPSFYKNKVFLLYGDFDSSERHALERNIIGYGGILENYMGPSVKYVVTQEQWDDSFEEALTENDNLVFVKPGWLEKCANLGKITPYQPFVVVPN